MVQASVHLSGATRSVELAAIGRRTCEAEYDLMLGLRPLLGGDGWSDEGFDDAAVGDSDESTAWLGTDGLHDRPTVAELLDALGGYLTDDVMEGTEGRLSFHARVASNVVAMIDRQLARGDRDLRAHRERLEGLGVESDAALATALRAGDFDDRLPEVTAALWPSVLAKLAVANPGYR
jgi:hypothetical protein